VKTRRGDYLPEKIEKRPPKKVPVAKRKEPVIFDVRKDTTLKDFLLERYPGSGMNTLRARLASGGIRLAGNKLIKLTHPLHKGDKIEIIPHARRAPDLPLHFRILYEDADLILIDKDSGILSVASDTEKNKTAYKILTDYLRAREGELELKIFVVHRLDKEASGLLLFAKSEEVKHKLQLHWNEYEKIYAALVEGSPTKNTGLIETYLEEKEGHFVRSKKVSKETEEGEAEGKFASTEYLVLKKTGNLTALEVKLHTGRKNQIRVHCAESGFPIAGDDKYGSGEKTELGRLALHAWKLKIKHPISGKLMLFSSPLPQGLKRYFTEQTFRR
jgi:RluA family pseudouridine synthase